MPYYFSLPIITDLTTHQQAAVNETEPLALSGGPGTGKSVVCLWRHIRNYATNTRNSLLLTYTKTLEYYLRESASSENTQSADNINRTYYWLSHHPTSYTEIIIDEGQDVGIEKYRTIKGHADIVSYGADNAQSLYEDKECSPEDLEDLFPDNEIFTLQKNFRNSKDILLFIRSVFTDLLILQETISQARATGLKPIVKVVGWEIKDEIKAIVDVINDFRGDTHNIGILVPIQKMVTEYYGLISEELEDDVVCTSYISDDESFNGLSGIHVTTFKSSKGLEFDTVIIPKFDSMGWYVDHLDKITEKDYYVGLTRTKTNLFLICKKNPATGAKGTYEIEYE